MKNEKKPFRLNPYVLGGQVIGCGGMNLLGLGDLRSMIYYLAMTAVLIGLSLVAPGE